MCVRAHTTIVNSCAPGEGSKYGLKSNLCAIATVGLYLPGGRGK